MSSQCCSPSGRIRRKAADTIKIGLIEPLSGRIAAVGKDALDAFTFAAEQVNARGGVLGGIQLEIIGLDNAMNAEKTTEQLKKAVDLRALPT